MDLRKCVNIVKDNSFKNILDVVGIDVTTAKSLLDHLLVWLAMMCIAVAEHSMLL